MRELSFKVKPRVSHTDSTAFLQDMNGTVLCTIDAHEFQSGDLQITIHPLEKMAVIVQTGKP
jgi:hypothetical protein